MSKRATPEANQAQFKTADQIATATQAGLEEGLLDELTKGLSCAARSLAALDEQEQLTLLSEAEIAYQNALCLVEQPGIKSGSPIAQKIK